MLPQFLCGVVVAVLDELSRPPVSRITLFTHGFPPLLTVDAADAARSFAKNGSPHAAIFASSFAVQSHSPHAHGSDPFRSRQRCRACASWTFTSRKYSSQYGRSSASGTSQTH